MVSGRQGAKAFVCVGLALSGLAASGCKARRAASHVANNGSAVQHEDFPFIAELMEDWGNGKFSQCTGAVISLQPFLVLTAAHCMEQQGKAVEYGLGRADKLEFVNDLTLRIGTIEIKPDQFYVMPETFPNGVKKFGDVAFFESQDINWSYDVVLLGATSTPMALSAVAPVSFDASYQGRVRVIGYGVHFSGETITHDDGSVGYERSPDSLHSGTNTIFKRSNGFIHLYTDAVDAGYALPSDDKTVSLPGDSGGPLLDESLRVIGVVSKGADPRDLGLDPTYKVSQFIDLSSPPIKAFLERHLNPAAGP